MSNTKRDRQREIEHQAANTKGLKDYGKSGFKKDGNLKKGYYQLKDHRVIRLSQLKRLAKV